MGFALVNQMFHWLTRRVLRQRRKYQWSNIVLFYCAVSARQQRDGAVLFHGNDVSSLANRLDQILHRLMWWVGQTRFY